MKKILSILLFTALAFQSCNKINEINNDGDLVPILFSEATEITQTQTGTRAGEAVTIDALILGSLAANDWSTLYTYLLGNKKLVAIDTITFLSTSDKAAPSKGFEPDVYYPLNGDNIYLKGIAPSALLMEEENKVKITNNVVTFAGLDGKQDIIATEKINAENENNPGIGNKNKQAAIALEFEHLLCKLSFSVQTKTTDASALWKELTELSVLEQPDRVGYNLQTDTTVAVADGLVRTKYIIHELKKGDEGLWYGELQIPHVNSSSDKAKLVGSVYVLPKANGTALELKIVGKNEHGTHPDKTANITQALHAGFYYEFVITFNHSDGINIQNVHVTEWNSIDQTPEGGLEIK